MRLLWSNSLNSQYDTGNTVKKILPKFASAQGGGFGYTGGGGRGDCGQIRRREKHPFAYFG